MIDLELRKKACEALRMKIWIADGKHGSALSGGCIVNSAGGLYFETGEKYKSSFHCHPGTLPVVQPLPAIEHDPAISEPLFLEWCAKNGLLWDLYSTRHGSQVSCAVYRPDHNGVHAHIFGADPSTARALAIVAASEKV